jgi:uncharacterized SAM-dependent methyltransferase
MNHQRAGLPCSMLAGKIGLFLSKQSRVFQHAAYVAVQFFYDERGATLFQKSANCLHAVTRAELDILKRNS